MNIKKNSSVFVPIVAAGLALANPLNAQEPGSVQRDSAAKVDSSYMIGHETHLPGLHGYTWMRTYGGGMIMPEKPDTSRRYMPSGELTTIGSGRLLGSYVQRLDLSSRTEPVDFRNVISNSKGTRFFVANARNYLMNIANRKDDFYVTPEGRAFRNYLVNLARHTPRTDVKTRRILNRALRDGVINPSEIRDSLGRPLIKETPVMIIGYKGRESAAGLFYVNLSQSQVRRNYLGEREKARTDSIRIARSAQARADSINEARRLREQQRSDSILAATQDSIRRAGATADSLRREQEARQRVPQATPDTTHYEFIPPIYKAPRSRGLEFAVGATYSTDQELGLGLEISAGLTNWLRLGAYGSYKIPQEHSIRVMPADTTQRATQLIGPGTYKSRTDVTTISDRQKGNVYEAGAEFSVTPLSWLDLFARAGARFDNVARMTDEKSTIEFTRDGALLQAPSVIEDSVASNMHPIYASFSGGARFNLTKNLFLEGSYSRIESKTGNQNRGKLGVGFKF